jgi:hypothetical protein
MTAAQVGLGTKAVLVATPSSEACQAPTWPPPSCKVAPLPVAPAVRPARSKGLRILPLTTVGNPWIIAVETSLWSLGSSASSPEL